MPEGDDGGLGQLFAHHARHQGEVVVLHQHDGVLGLGLLHHGVSKDLVDLDVVIPVTGAEDGADVGNMAKRPQAFIGQTIVVAGLLFGGQPDAANLVGGFFRRYADAIMRID